MVKLLIQKVCKKMLARYQRRHKMLCLICTVKPWLMFGGVLGITPFKYKCVHNLEERWIIEKSVFLMSVAAGIALVLLATMYYEFYAFYDFDQPFWDAGNVNACGILSLGIFYTSPVILTCVSRAKILKRFFMSAQIVLIMVARINKEKVIRTMVRFGLKSIVYVLFSILTPCFLVYLYCVDYFLVKVILYFRIYSICMCTLGVKWIIDIMMELVEILDEELCQALEDEISESLTKISDITDAFIVMYDANDRFNAYVCKMMILHVVTMITLAFANFYVIVLRGLGFSIWRTYSQMAYDHLMLIWFGFMTIYSTYGIEKYTQKVEMLAKILNSKHFELQITEKLTVGYIWTLKIVYVVFTYVLVGIQLYISTVLKKNAETYATEKAVL